MARHPGVEQLLAFFQSDHLAEDLQAIAKPIEQLARGLVEKLPEDGPELTAGLRKLLEAKDCLVRHALVTRGAPV